MALELVCLLEEEGLVGRAAPFRHEEELVLVTLSSVEVELGRQVGSGHHGNRAKAKKRAN